MMRSLKKYIAESVKTYNYTIKIAGEVDKNFLELFKYNLNKFDLVKITDPVTTPIQKDPYGFPELNNVSVTIMKAEFRYPATEPMIQQVARLLGHNVNMIRVVNGDFNDSINAETAGYDTAKKNSPLLTHAELEEQPGAKEASKAYSRSYLDSAKKYSEETKMEFEFSGKKTPSAFDPFKPYTADTSKGEKSPFTSMTRIAKPSTGAKN